MAGGDSCFFWHTQWHSREPHKWWTGCCQDCAPKGPRGWESQITESVLCGKEYFYPQIKLWSWQPVLSPFPGSENLVGMYNVQSSSKVDQTGLQGLVGKLECWHQQPLALSGLALSESHGSVLMGESGSAAGTIRMWVFLGTEMSPCGQGASLWEQILVRQFRIMFDKGIEMYRWEPWASISKT